MIRQAFNTLSSRERILLAAFIWLGLLIWLSSLWRGLQARAEVYSQTAQALEMQQLLFDNEDLINLRLEEVRAQLDSSRTYSREQLFGKVDSLARQAGLDYDISSPSSQEDETFSYHTVRISIDNARIKDLILFDERVKAEAPYLTLSNFQVSPQRNDPRKLNADLEVASFEFSRHGL